MRRRNYRGNVYRSNKRKEGFRKQDVRSSGEFKTLFNRDLSAMNQVWRMIKEGTIRAFGEIGRQY